MLFATNWTHMQSSQFPKGFFNIFGLFHPSIISSKILVTAFWSKALSDFYKMPPLLIRNYFYNIPFTTCFFFYFHMASFGCRSEWNLKYFFLRSASVACFACVLNTLKSQNLCWFSRNWSKAFKFKAFLKPQWRRVAAELSFGMIYLMSVFMSFWNF